MANLSEDIQCAGSDTRPPMLDRIDFASWQQCIRLYCPRKENGVNILKSIDEDHSRWECLEKHLLKVSETMHGVQVQLVIGELRTELGMQIQDLALNVDNVFQADDCNAFDSYVDEAPTAQTMFMANLSSADHVYDETGLSYDSDVLSEVHDHDHYRDAIYEHHEVHEMHDDVQPNYVVDSHANYTSDSNMILYDHFCNRATSRSNSKQRQYDSRVERENLSITTKHSDVVPIHEALDSHNKELHEKINALHDLNERWRAENDKVKRHYKELYDSIRIMCAKTIEKTDSLLTEVVNLKAQIQENHKSNCVTMPTVKSKVLAPGRYAIDVEPIPPCIRNNREVHLDYFKHLKESVETLREIVDEAKVKRPLDR
uniref:Integrase, catalytic region, zinc finger, CCHC-type, peptidase aspartic, catalytic n=1 Tax=Tanacetum cinerariifolium TaxID=118510 RepID=A0A699GVS1_TANCI|nr:integrase, catalytic region, zinc finger, CCHC-type, peptidase aspartic, catalytic [Tanacetum cinerariifolium]